jgi:choline dehydrogenase-like flavoprotein
VTLVPTHFLTSIDRHHRYDALVIGAGLTGAWAAKELAEAGLDVLMLDAGPRLAPAEVSDVEGRTAMRRREAARRQPVQSQIAAYWTHPPHLFVDDFDHPYSDVANSPFAWIRGRQIGGRSFAWGGVTLRLSDHEFGDPDRDGIGPRWPIRHADLAPYYEKVERLLGVSGAADGLSQLPDGAFLAATPFTSAERSFKDVVETRWPDRHVIACRGIAPDGSGGTGGDPRWTPRSALHRILPAALATGRAAVRPDSIVSHLVIDPLTGRLSGAACVDRLTRDVFEVRARVVVLGASTIESVRLMLNSRSPAHPAGIGNSSGLVGRGLVDHLAVRAIGPAAAASRAASSDPLGGPHAILMPRFRNLGGREGLDFVRGYGIWGGLQRRVTADPAADEPTWLLTALLEVLPDDHNRVEIDEGLPDAWGVKSVRITMRYGDNERRMAEDAGARLLEMAEAAGLTVRHRSMSGPGAYVHELGGARMGSDARSSVLSPFNQCWDAKNLFVVDGSAFPTAGWQNPTHTMMALAVRAAAFIVEEMRTGRL